MVFRTLVRPVRYLCSVSWMSIVYAWTVIMFAYVMLFAKHSEYGVDQTFPTTLQRMQGALRLSRRSASSQFSGSLVANASSRICDASSLELLGTIHVNTHHIPSKESIEASLQNVSMGGEWKPHICRSEQKLAVIIPYRARWPHLRLLLSYLHPMLQRQQKHYKIFVVEQAYNELFNKGLIMNAAFSYAMKLDSWDCVIFHDVDMIPENDHNLYECGPQPRHLSPALDEMRYTLMYPNLVGGVLALRRDHMIRVNGFSNIYWGWGAEDDDMYHRIECAGYQLMRPEFHIGRFKMVPHQKRKRSGSRYHLLLKSDRWPHEGLNSLHTLKFKVLKVTNSHLFTNITMDVGSRPENLTRGYSPRLLHRLAGFFNIPQY